MTLSTKFKPTRKQIKAGKLLKDTRLSLKVSQQAIADLLGVSQSYISAMENGKQAFTETNAKVLIREFKKQYKVTIKPEDFGISI